MSNVKLDKRDWRSPWFVLPKAQALRIEAREGYYSSNGTYTLHGEERTFRSREELAGYLSRECYMLPDAVKNYITRIESASCTLRMYASMKRREGVIA